MLWVFAALACDGDAPENKHLSDPIDDTATGVVDDTATEETCGNSVDDNGNGTADGCDWSGTLVLEGTKLLGTDDSSEIGNTLVVCDANGDGVDDVVASASGYYVDTPAVYVFYGPIHEYRTAKDADYALMGDGGMYTGASVDCRRDFDGDGVADIIVGEPGGDGGFEPATVYVVPGLGTGQQPLAGAAQSSWIGPDLDERLGYQLVAIDADGDETDEVAVTPEPPSQVGIAYVFDDSGPGAHDVDDALAYVYGEENDRMDVFTVGNAGDLDGDGVEELALEGEDQTGEQLLVFGAPLVGAISKSDADIEIIGGPPNSVRWSGIGHADLDADGNDDLFVGNPGQNQRDGAVYAFLAPIAQHTNTDAAELQVRGPVGSDYTLGSDVTSAGDVDGDDIPDLLIGAADGRTVFLQYGGDPRGVVQVEKTAQAEWWGPDQTGATVAAGDVTGEGVVDFLIGSPEDGENHEGSITIMPAFEI